MKRMWVGLNLCLVSLLSVFTVMRRQQLTMLWELCRCGDKQFGFIPTLLWEKCFVCYLLMPDKARAHTPCMSARTESSTVLCDVTSSISAFSSQRLRVKCRLQGDGTCQYLGLLPLLCETSDCKKKRFVCVCGEVDMHFRCEVYVIACSDNFLPPGNKVLH